jgi:ribose transport system permease protein
MTLGNASISDVGDAGLEARLETTSGGRGAVARVLQRDGIGAFGVLVVVTVVSWLFVSGFGNADNARNVLLQASFPAVIAIGMTFAIMTGGIDLSVGSVYALSAVLVTKMLDTSLGEGQNVVVAIAVALGAALLIGLVQGLLISRTRMPPFIVTLAGLYGVRGLTIFVSNEGADVYSAPSKSAFYKFGTATPLWVNNSVVIAILLFVAGHILLTRTSFGLTSFAVGGNEPAALLMGLKVRRTKTIVYVMSAGLAGVAGIMNAAYAQSGIPNGGQGYELDAIAAVVIGGTLLTGGAGSLIGTMSGVLLLAVVRSLINHGAFGHLPSSAQQVVTGAFVIIVVLLQVFLRSVERR